MEKIELNNGLECPVIGSGTYNAFTGRSPSVLYTD